MQIKAREKIRDLPVSTWAIGLIFLLIGSYLYTQEKDQLVVSLVPAALGMILLASGSILTISVDRSANSLILSSRSLLRWKKTAIALQDIGSIEVESSRSTSGRSNQATYRVVIQRKDGSSHPLRGYFSSGLLPKQKRANELRAMIGAVQQEQGPAGLVGLVSQLSENILREQQEALSGSQEQERITDDVHWFLQTRASGGTGITRWHSPDVKFRDGFLYMVQKLPGQKSAGGGLLGGLSSLLIRQSLSLYGFGGEDTPGGDTAELLAIPDAGLAELFIGFTSNPGLARQILTPWVVHALVDWGRRYPLKSISNEKVFGQLAVLFSPSGLYLATLGVLIPEAVEELTGLGVELVKTQS